MGFNYLYVLLDLVGILIVFFNLRLLSTSIKLIIKTGISLSKIRLLSSYVLSIWGGGLLVVHHLQVEVFLRCLLLMLLAYIIWPHRKEKNETSITRKIKLGA